MKKTLLAMLVVAASASLPLVSAQAGCLSGAAVGAVGGHFVGRGHALLGAAAGCAVGHHSARVQERNREREPAQVANPYGHSYNR